MIHHMAAVCTLSCLVSEPVGVFWETRAASARVSITSLSRRPPVHLIRFFQDAQYPYADLLLVLLGCGPPTEVQPEDGGAVHAVM